MTESLQLSYILETELLFHKRTLEDRLTYLARMNCRVRKEGHLRGLRLRLYFTLQSSFLLSFYKALTFQKIFVGRVVHKLSCTEEDRQYQNRPFALDASLMEPKRCF